MTTINFLNSRKIYLSSERGHIDKSELTDVVDMTFAFSSLLISFGNVLQDRRIERPVFLYGRNRNTFVG